MHLDLKLLNVLSGLRVTSYSPPSFRWFSTRSNGLKYSFKICDSLLSLLVSFIITKLEVLIEIDFWISRKIGEGATWSKDSSFSYWGTTFQQKIDFVIEVF